LGKDAGNPKINEDAKDLDGESPDCCGRNDGPEIHGPCKIEQASAPQNICKRPGRGTDGIFVMTAKTGEHQNSDPEIEGNKVSSSAATRGIPKRLM
jgi:hypothetical protein